MKLFQGQSKFMKGNDKFINMPMTFWAAIRLVSQKAGYTENKKVKIHTIQEIEKVLFDSNIKIKDKKFSTNDLRKYFEYRARILNSYVKPRLMDAKKAKKIFKKLFLKFKPKCPLPLNKQKGKKRKIAYLTCIVNILIEANLKGLDCNYDPKELTSIVNGKKLLRVLSRRVDGAFPNIVNPIAIWEIKEYYYTTTFGSRVADGVYETQLDGMELTELLNSEGKKVLHYLFVDAYSTWWDKGKSYLCRMIDMLNMKYVDEILFGHEVVERLPKLVRKWKKK